MNLPSLVDMLEAGAHFGHQVSRWHPKMKPYIYMERNGVHIINLEKTLEQLKEVLAVVEKMAAEGKQILFVSTKAQAREIVKKAAIEVGMPYLVDRWLGGMLTNFSEIRKLIRKYNDLKEKQAQGAFELYTKKEQLEIARQVEKMSSYLEGLSTLERMPDALFLPAVQKEKTTLAEARRVGVPIIGICDSNANPDKVEYVIPANDDAVKSITLLVNLVAGAVKRGKEEWEKKQQQSGKSSKVEEKKIAEPVPSEAAVASDQ
ncbi:MAG: 30S ribosomal protein S2 [Candidatus Magasanikbacteria bacterium]|nr:30S ribosomal protein S2 [Candidatus Magasanikbacteria bacterium]